MKKSRFKSRRKQNDQLALQITSMADLLMIVLVFLLKSFSTSAVNVAPSAGTLLPEAHANADISEALKVEISENGVQVEGKPVLELQKARFPKETALNTSAVQSLNDALSAEKKRQNLIASHNPDVKVDAKVLILAGQTVPYATIKTVLASAANNGFSDFKLVVARIGE